MSIYLLPEVRGNSRTSQEAVTHDRIETSDPALFEVEAKARGYKYPRTHIPNCLKPFPVPRAPKEPREFSPQLDQIGAWVRFGSASDAVTGQVWAEANTREVWVADGREFFRVDRRDLEPAAPTEDVISTVHGNLMKVAQVGRWMLLRSPRRRYRVAVERGSDERIAFAPDEFTSRRAAETFLEGLSEILESRVDLPWSELNESDLRALGEFMRPSSAA